MSHCTRLKAHILKLKKYYVFELCFNRKQRAHLLPLGHRGSAEDAVGGITLRPWLMTIGPAGSNPATMKECFLNPKWYPGKQIDSSQGACVLIGHLNVWIYWVTWDLAANRGKGINGCKIEPRKQPKSSVYPNACYSNWWVWHINALSFVLSIIVAPCG